ncbi:MAG: hypothetical protein FWC64_09700 [Treponema sp.]|nr:hypothetical protein [Treponema sp.]
MIRTTRTTAGTTVYRRKLVFLSALAGALALVYALTLVFDPDRRHGRAFAWLDHPGLHYLADRIEISGPAGTTVLVRRNDVWVLSDPGAGGAEGGPGGAWQGFPVRQQRVQDLFAALSRREAYTLRANSLEARERLGLSIGSASRIVVRGGPGLPLVDLLIGYGGAVGREVYLARAYEREIYSGDDRFSLFTDSGPGFWLDFRLFAASYSAAMVQQAEFAFAPPGGAPPVSYVLRRDGGGWVLQGNESAALVNARVEAWLRAVLEAEGEGLGTEAPPAIEASVTLWFGDGTARTIQVGPAEGGEGYRRAVVSPSPLVYVLSPWTVDRLFRKSGDFLR